MHYPSDRGWKILEFFIEEPVKRLILPAVLTALTLLSQFTSFLEKTTKPNRFQNNVCFVFLRTTHKLKLLVTCS